MKTNYSQILLQDPELVKELESTVLAKYNEYLEFGQKRTEFLLLNHYDSQDDFGKYFLEKAFDTMLDGPVIERIEKDLTSLCFSLREVRSKGVTTKWSEAYDRALYSARIEDVAAHYIGEQNWNRNVKCPFHADGGPSLKIYTKTNTFFCFGCNAHGAPVNFVMQIENCSFREAVLKLTI